MDHGTGKAGEEHIAALMEARGYRVVSRNFHSRYGEIDIIGENGEYLVFVEVKTREVGGLSDPFESITPQKQRRLILTAEMYLEAHPSPLQPRFDAAAVYTKNGRIVSEKYLENAFSL